MQSRLLALSVLCFGLALSGYYASCGGGAPSPPPPPCKTIGECLSSQTERSSGTGPCQYGNPPQIVQWVFRNRSPNRTIAVSYTSYLAYQGGQTQEGPSKLVFVPPSNSLNVECWMVQPGEGQITRNVNVNSACFTDDTNCPGGLQVTQDISACMKACEAGDPNCPNLTPTVTPVQTAQLGVMYADLLLRPLPGYVDLSPLISAIAPTCPARNPVYLDPTVVATGRPAPIESYGQSCVFGWTLPPNVLPVPNSAHYVRDMWITVPPALRGEFARRGASLKAIAVVAFAGGGRPTITANFGTNLPSQPAPKDPQVDEIVEMRALRMATGNRQPIVVVAGANYACYRFDANAM